MLRFRFAAILIGLSFSLISFGQRENVEKNLIKHVDYLTSPELKGRKAGSEGERLAAEYLYSELEKNGVEMLTGKDGQDFYIVENGDSLLSRNIVGIVQGYDPELRDEYIVVGANLDNIGTHILNVNGSKQEQIYPGADANASGVACLIELAKKISSSSFMFRRSIIFVGFGAKEKGMAGSWYFINQAFQQKNDISMMVDINTVGRSGPANLFTYYTCIPNTDITNAVNRVSNKLMFMMPQMGSGRIPSSDYLAFYEQQIPVALFTTGVHNDLYTIRDDAESLDYGLMEGVCEYLYSFVMDVAAMDLKVEAPAKSAEVGGKMAYTPYEVDRAPEFFKGDERNFLEEWVYVYLRYPQVAVDMGIQGVVNVEFVVEADGSVTNVRVTRSVDEDLDREAVRVVSASPKWRPAIKNGEKVRVKYSLPIEFRLKKR
jgi:TonB family protein